MKRMLWLVWPAVVLSICSCSSDNSPTVPSKQGFGALSIHIEQVFLPVPWTVTCPGGFSVVGVGDSTIVGVPEGDCSVAWGVVDGWESKGSNPVAIAITAEDTAAVSGVFGTPFPGTADQLVANLKTGYTFGQVDILQDVYAPEYVSFLQQITQDLFPAIGNTIDTDEDLIIAQHIFSGEPITNSNGNVVPGISEIAFQALERATDWTLAGIGERIPGSVAASYDVSILISRPGFSSLRAAGTIRFFAASSDTIIDGTTLECWKLVGQDDLTSLPAKPIEATPWGTIRALCW